MQNNAPLRFAEDRVFPMHPMVKYDIHFLHLSVKYSDMTYFLHPKVKHNGILFLYPSVKHNDIAPTIDHS